VDADCSFLFSYGMSKVPWTVLKIEVSNFSETSVSDYQSTLYRVSEDLNLRLSAFQVGLRFTESFMIWRFVLVSSGSESPSMVAFCEHGAEDWNFVRR
jgi:hypothetical protein